LRFEVIIFIEEEKNIHGLENIRDQEKEEQEEIN